VFELNINKINIQDQIFITSIQKEIFNLALSEKHSSYFSFYF